MCICEMTLSKDTFVYTNFNISKVNLSYDVLILSGASVMNN